MASELPIDVVGTVVAVTSADYSFPDEKTGQTKTGTSHRLWLNPDAFGMAPVEVTVQAQSRFVAELSTFSEPFRAHCSLVPVANSKNGRAVLSYKLADFKEAAPLANRPARDAKAS